MAPPKTLQSGAETAPLEDAPGESPTLGPGALVGRYVVVEPLGSGTGGAVYAAYDAHLGRRVAIKVLATRSESGEAAWARVIKEAQLVARLDHPNVVTVHDVGVADDRAFIAMELVEGTDLATWMARRHAEPRLPKWRELLQPVLLAGRGLAAAHERHIVHGDFKPANVLIGIAKDEPESSGKVALPRVRVTDFGIARLRDQGAGVDHSRTGLSSDPDTSEMLSTANDETTPHALWGTPLYMAPELFDGQRPDETSDIYSFSASLYEALWGRPPAQGRTLMALYAAKLDGPDAPRNGGIPRRLREIIVQGLSPDPTRRPSSVADMLSVIDGCLRPRRRSYVWAGAAVSVSASFALLGLHAWTKEASCSHADEHLAGVWDAQSKAGIQEAMLATGLPYADETWDRVERQLDNYANTWVGLHTETCLATQRGEQSTELLDRKMMCLDERRVELSALTEVLAQTNGKALEGALDASVALPDVSDCQDGPRLLGGDPDANTSPAAEVIPIRQDIARARALANMGQLEQAFELLVSARNRANELGHVRSAVEATRWMGDIEQRRGKLEHAHELLQDAALTAEVEKIDDVAARAGVALIWLLVSSEGTPQEAQEWLPHVDVAVRRAKPGPEVLINFYQARGTMNVDLQQNDEALADFERVETLLSELPDPRAHRADLANSLGYYYHQRSDWDLSEKYYREALALKEDLYGPNHPGVGQVMDNVATALMARGELDAALRIDQRALEILTAAHGPDHPVVTTVEANMAGTLAEMGRLDESAEAYSRIIAVYERTYGGDHVYAAASRLNLAAVLGRQEKYGEAAGLARKAAKVIEKTYGPKHPWVGYALINIGTAELRLHEPDAAVINLERALEILESQPDTSNKLAQGRFALAQAIFEAGGDRTRAVILAHKALEGFSNNAPERERVQTWLDARP